MPGRPKPLKTFRRTERNVEYPVRGEDAAILPFRELLLQPGLLAINDRHDRRVRHGADDNLLYAGCSRINPGEARMIIRQVRAGRPVFTQRRSWDAGRSPVGSAHFDKNTLPAIRATGQLGFRMRFKLTSLHRPGIAIQLCINCVQVLFIHADISIRYGLISWHYPC